MNPTLVLQEIRKTLDGAPDAEALCRIRAVLDEPALFWELDQYLRGVNDPETKAVIISDIVAIARWSSDRSAERKNDLANVRYGIGIGGAIATSGLIALATVGTAILVLPVFAGC